MDRALTLCVLFNLTYDALPHQIDRLGSRSNPFSQSWLYQAHSSHVHRCTVNPFVTTAASFIIHIIMINPPPAARETATTTIIPMDEYFPASVYAGCRQGRPLQFDTQVPPRLVGIFSPDEWATEIMDPINAILAQHVTSMKWSLCLVCIPCCYLALLHAVQGANLAQVSKINQLILSATSESTARRQVQIRLEIASNGNNNATHWMWLAVSHPPLPTNPKSPPS